jgi:hypothetical protein
MRKLRGDLKGRVFRRSTMEERTEQRLDGWSWAIFFVRWVLGLIFFMAGRRRGRQRAG